MWFLLLKSCSKLRFQITTWAFFENSYYPSDLKCKHWIGNTVNTGAILRCWCGWWKEWVNERTLDEMTIDRSFPSTEALVRLYYLCWCYWKESPIDREMLDHLHAKDFPNTCWWQLQQKATRQALLITLQLTKTPFGIADQPHLANFPSIVYKRCHESCQLSSTNLIKSYFIRQQFTQRS